MHALYIYLIKMEVHIVLINIFKQKSYLYEKVAFLRDTITKVNCT